MKTHIQRWFLHRRLRALARHLNDLHEQSRELERTKRYYEAKAGKVHAQLLEIGRVRNICGVDAVPRDA